MPDKRLFRCKICIIFLSWIILVAFFFFIHFSSNNTNDLWKITYKLQDQIFLNDSLSNKILLDFVFDFTKNKTPATKLLQKYNNDKHELFYSIFVLNKLDSLIFWTDNSVPLSFLKFYENNRFFNSGNGWYRLQYIENNDFSFVIIYLVKHEYLYQNEYLQNNFTGSLKNLVDCSIITNKNGNDIYSLSNQYLFSITLNQNGESFSNKTTIFNLVFLLFVLLSIFLIYYSSKKVYKRFKTKFSIIFSFIIVLLLFRLILFIFEIPSLIFQSEIFSPKLFAFSNFLPSIGEFLLHSIFLFSFSIFVFKHFNFKNRNISSISKYLLLVFNSFFIIFSFKIIDFTFKTLIIDSKIPLDLNDIFSLTFFSFICFTIITLNVISFFLITSRIIFISFNFSNNLSRFYIVTFLSILVIYVLNEFTKIYSNIEFLFLIVYVLLFPLFTNYKVKSTIPNLSIVFIIYFSILSAYYLQKNNSIKERNNRIYLAKQLLYEQNDPIVLYQFTDFEQKILSDSILHQYILQQVDSINANEKIEEYIYRNYHSGFWKKFDFQITICRYNDNLILKPENIQINCFKFFQDLRIMSGLSTKNENFFIIKYENGDNGYLAVLNYDSIMKTNQLKIFIEIIPRSFYNYLGFPELLVDKQSSNNVDISDYSYAIYHNFYLHKRVGRYFYRSMLNKNPDEGTHLKFYSENGFSHLLYKGDNSNIMVISIKNKNYFDLISPFSYFFVIFLSFHLLLYYLILFPFSYNFNALNLRSRLQFSMVIVIIFSFLSIGAFSISYIISLNDQKNKDILSEKTHSVLVELDHKFSEKTKIDNSISAYLNELLIKFSEVYFTDITLFDLKGNMIGTSRSQIFDQKLIGEKMNPVAFFNLFQESKSFFIQNESIGKQEYLSAYVPFFNNESKVIAYLNLPYFAKENDLKKEISIFLVAYLNIYVILIALTITISILISNYFSRPLKLLYNQISKLKLGKQNEKINWYRDDEIGKLVTEYNRMVDELTVSAELLARSERESAWREMAKQVAHEIKNPLTPMRLGVQHIQRAWNEQVPDINIRIQKFTQMMIDQIDTLSSIANEFSDFAKMPISKKELLDVSEIILNSIILFKTYDNISIIFQNVNHKPLFVLIDKEQLLRVFNNMIKNAIQAIGDYQHGEIKIILSDKNGFCEIEISDNGSGISSEFENKIFSPNFTTKSGGMGLGLAIVKSIIDNAGGKIHYISSENNGTTFFIKLPTVKN